MYSDIDWRVLDRSLAFDAGPRLSVWRERVLLPDGREIDDYFQVALPDFVVLVALTADDCAVMLRGYKHGARRPCLTFPGGLLEPGEDPEVAARRELREETGFECDEIASLGSFVVNGNQRCAKAHMFYGTGARLTGAPTETDLEGAQRLLLPFDQLALHVGQGGFNLMPHATALGLAVMHRARQTV
ncbi:NUDIX hydrolase [Reyranella sp.]|uniref:NUDIX hydrolase n=1 Tax=Reyranella sp. TaxID=1929291 RepID=UPI003F72C824